MFEPAAYTLFQVIGFCLTSYIFGMSIGVLMGKAAQRKHDIWMFGPKYMQNWTRARLMRSRK